MKIYFAGSIRGGREDKDLYQQIINLLDSYGVVLTEHIGNQKLSHLGESQLTSEFIYDRDIEWLMSADVVVAEVTSPSLGVGYEIAKAEELGKKVICLYRPSENRLLSAMIAGNKHLIIKGYSSINELKEVFDSALRER